MKIFCKKCFSTEISKNGFQNGKQKYVCNVCHAQFLPSPIDDDKNLYEKVLKNFLYQEKGTLAFCETKITNPMKYTSLVDKIKRFLANDIFYSGYDDLDGFLKKFKIDYPDYCAALLRARGNILPAKVKRKLISERKMPEL